MKDDKKNNPAVTDALNQAQSLQTISKRKKKSSLDAMERTRTGLFLSLLLYSLQICRTRVIECPSNPLNNLTCHSDLNYTVTCLWNSSHVYKPTDVCTLHSVKIGTDPERFKDSCDLKPFDVSKPALKSCSLHFHKSYTFLSHHEIALNVSCLPSKHTENITFKPWCQVKVNPPGKPIVNLTTVTWLAEVTEHSKIKKYETQIQWKLKDISWNDPSVLTKTSLCEWECKSQLDPSELIKDEIHEIRVRVKPRGNAIVNGIWSEWSPTESWKSPVGKPAPELGVSVRGVLTLAVSAVLLALIVLLLRKKQLIYLVKGFKDAPLPDPGKSEMFQNWFTLNSKNKENSLASKPEKSAVQTWLSSHFSEDCVQSLLSPVDIVSSEVTSTLDSMDFCRPEVKIMPQGDKCSSSGSSFSNPSYSELCTSPCVSTVKLHDCAVDARSQTVRGQGEEQNTEQDSDVVAKNHQEIVKLLFMGSDNKNSVVISGYEKVEQQQAERLRLQSVDSGMCTSEEVSQESMEADSISVTDGNDEGTPCKEEKEDNERNMTKLDFQQLFAGSGSISGKNSFQICLDYKQIPRLQPESPDRPCQDSGVSKIAEESERKEDSTEDDNQPSEKTCFLFPPHPPTASTLPQQTLNIHGSPLSPFLTPLNGNDILKQIALSGSRLKQSCDDGYMPVRQKES